jgi:hypothetical protein
MTSIGTIITLSPVEMTTSIQQMGGVTIPVNALLAK